MSTIFNKTIEKNVYNKFIPQTIEEEIILALSHYPELKFTPIHFEFKNRNRKSIIKAQTKYSSLFKPKSKRHYSVFINNTFKVGDTSILLPELPSDILIGFLGQELGRIMSYEQMSNVKLISFLCNYSFNKNLLKNSEQSAKNYALQNGMESYLLKTENYMANLTKIPETYKSKLTKAL